MMIPNKMMNTRSRALRFNGLPMSTPVSAGYGWAPTTGAGPLLTLREEAKANKTTRSGRGSTMWKGQTRRWVWDLTATVLLVAGSLWIWRTSRINHELRATLEVVAAVAKRSTVVDRLVGRRVPLEFLHETVGMPDEDRDVVEARLLWIRRPGTMR